MKLISINCAISKTANLRQNLSSDIENDSSILSISLSFLCVQRNLCRPIDVSKSRNFLTRSPATSFQLSTLQDMARDCKAWTSLERRRLYTVHRELFSSFGRACPERTATAAFAGRRRRMTRNTARKAEDSICAHPDKTYPMRPD